MSVARRLAILVSVPLVVVLGLGLFLRIQIDQVEENSRFVAESRIAALATLSSISRQFEHLRVEARSYLTEDDPDGRAAIVQQFDEGEAELDRLVDLYADSLVYSDRGRRLLGEYQSLSREWLAGTRTVFAMVDEGRQAEAMAIVDDTLLPLGDRLSEVTREWVSNNQAVSEEAGRRAADGVASLRLELTLAVLVMLLVGGVLGVLTLRGIVRPIQSLEEAVEGIAGGAYDTPVPHVDAPDETGALARSISVLRDGARAMDEQRWVRSHASTIIGDLQGTTTLEEYGRGLLAGLMPVLGGGVASVYVRTGEGGRLRRVASYGLAAGAGASDTVAEGEGLVGQCAREGRRVSLEGLPPDYLAIEAGGGSAPPRTVGAWPLTVGSTVGAVLEIATFQESDERGEELLERVLPAAALRLEVLQRTLSLRETEAFYRSVLEQAPDGLMVVNEAGLIEVANRRCEELFGYSTEDLVGSSVERLVPDAVRASHSALRAEYHANPTAREMGSGRELRGRREDGSLFPIEVGLSPMPGSDEGLKVAVSIRDITERKAAEEELRRASTLSDVALELTKAGYWRVPLDGSGRWIASERAMLIHGEAPTPDGVQSLEVWAEQVRAGDEAAAQATFDNFEAAVAGEVPFYDATYAYQRPVDDRVVWLHALGTVVHDDDGTPTVMYGVSQDVTDFKELESELVEAKDAAEAATRMKSMFLANMSHEIRTPMNAVIGLSHLALKTELTPKQRDYVHKIHNAGTSLLGIINDILDYSKIEAGKLDIETVDFTLDDVIANVTTVTAHKAYERGLEFLTRVSSDVPPVLRGDPVRLGQILTNLVNNAIKFTEEGEVHVGVEVLQRAGSKCQLQITVRDTGVGMTDEQASRLFQPFTQGDMSTTREYGGTGLGLSICRRIAELMGGQIWVSSRPGEGSTFTCTCWLGVGEGEGPNAVVPEKLATLRALVVDDNEAAREILHDMLSELVRDVEVVASGSEAVASVREAAGEAPFDVVFMDWRMPGMNGLEASRALRDDAELDHAPAIVMVTAFEREDIREEAEQIGLEGFLLKPVTRSLLVDALVSVYADSAEQALAAGRALDQGFDLSGLEVLLVEDNDINQQVAVELIEGVGGSVTVASNGKEAVDLILSGGVPPRFDAVLMDLQMPVMDGLRATETIRGDGRFADLPIVAMTAHATLEERQRCLDAGMNEHVAKPIDPALLFDTLQRIHRGPGGERSTGKPDALPAELVGVPGLDAREGLGRVAGNAKLYLRLLRQFAVDNEKVVREIQALIAEGADEDAQRAAHTVKSVSGTLGAGEVQTAAARVEELLRGGARADEVERALDELALPLGTLLAGLEGALGPAQATEASGPAVGADEVETAVSGLIGLLADFDASAIDFLEEHEAALKPVFDHGGWSEFAGRVRSFAFVDALPMLRRAGEAHGLAIAE